MKKVTMKAMVSEECIKCGTCIKVCPVNAIQLGENKAEINEDSCVGCGNCEQRCPTFAVEMVKREDPFVLSVDPESVDQDKLKEICRKAKFNPEQLVCYCTGTRAKEIAAAILKGAKTPEDLTLMTGIRSGCKVECIQPILRLLKAAGITPELPQGYQWYGKTVTAWEVSEKVKEKYKERGFRFDDDRELLDSVVEEEGGTK